MARHARRVTKVDLDRLQARAKAKPELTAYVADAGQPGLVIQARRGRVRFVFEYRAGNGGARRRMQLDDYGAITLEQARKIAGELRGQVAASRDPAVERERERRDAVTVAEVAGQYLEDLRQRAETGAKRGKPSGYASARYLLERSVLPKLGALRLRDVTSDHVRKLHRAMKDTPGAANRMLTALSAVYGYADKRELVAPRVNPVRHVERFEEKGERRALTGQELGRLGQALREAEDAGSIHPSGLLVIKLLALTGFRLSEVVGHIASDRRGKREGMRWGDVDLDRGLVTLPSTKTGRQVRVIGRAAVELLKTAKPAGAQADDCVIPGSDRRGGRQRGAGTLSGRPFVGVDRVRRILYRRAGIEGKGADLHSLRHSFASIGAHLHSGRFAAHVSPLLGHGYTRREITERYITGDPEALKPAADAVAGAIAAHLGLGERGKVVEFNRRGRRARGRRS